jgi:Trypsin-like peptidase domain
MLPWLAVPWLEAPSPALADRAVIRPEFQSGRESFFGSYGFVVAGTNSGQQLVLTALHVLDEVAKFRGIDCSPGNTTYTGHELPKHINNVLLYDPFAAKWMLAELGAAADMVPLPNARISAQEPYSQSDIAAFRVSSPTSLRPLQLAELLPGVGDPIWLAAKLEPNAKERTAQAVVVEISPETFVFRFGSTSGTGPLHTSGAPLLNRAGEVVGINVGGGILDGEKLGHGVHVASVRRHLGW